MYPVAWEKICRHKYEGVLGVRRNQDINGVNIAKLGWKILTERTTFA